MRKKLTPNHLSMRTALCVADTFIEKRLQLIQIKYDLHSTDLHRHPKTLEDFKLPSCPLIVSSYTEKMMLWHSTLSRVDNGDFEVHIYNALLAIWQATKFQDLHQAMPEAYQFFQTAQNGDLSIRVLNYMDFLHYSYKRGLVESVYFHI